MNEAAWDDPRRLRAHSWEAARVYSGPSGRWRENIAELMSGGKTYEPLLLFPARHTFFSPSIAPRNLWIIPRSPRLDARATRGQLKCLDAALVRWRRRARAVGARRAHADDRPCLDGCDAAHR